MDVNCPYCDKEIEAYPSYYADMVSYGYDENDRGRVYYEEYHVKCPHCSKKFRWFENYEQINDTCLKMEDVMY